MKLKGPLALLLLALLLLAPAAQATYEPLGSGATKLKLEKSFLALLKHNKVRLSAVPPARLRGGVVSFPVSSGKFDPTNAKGTVEHEGALRFKAPRGSLPLKALQPESRMSCSRCSPSSSSSFRIQAPLSLA